MVSAQYYQPSTSYIYSPPPPQVDYIFRLALTSYIFRSELTAHLLPQLILYPPSTDSLCFPPSTISLYFYPSTESLSFYPSTSYIPPPPQVVTDYIFRPVPTAHIFISVNRIFPPAL